MRATCYTAEKACEDNYNAYSKVTDSMPCKKVVCEVKISENRWFYIEGIYNETKKSECLLYFFIVQHVGRVNGWDRVQQYIYNTFPIVLDTTPRQKVGF